MRGHRSALLILIVLWFGATAAGAGVFIWTALQRGAILPALLMVALAACGSSAPAPGDCAEMEATLQAGAEVAGDSTCLDVVVLEWGYIKNDVCNGRNETWACVHMGLAIEEAIMCAVSMPELYAYLAAYEAWQVLSQRPECQEGTD